MAFRILVDYYQKMSICLSRKKVLFVTFSKKSICVYSTSLHSRLPSLLALYFGEILSFILQAPYLFGSFKLDHVTGSSAGTSKEANA